MALARRGGNRFSTNIWPGFVDAMTALLLVLMFVLSIFMIVQSVLRDTLNTKEGELTALNAQVANLAKALSLSQKQEQALTGQLEDAKDKADQQDALITTLTSQLDARKSDLAAANQKITAFETQVAALINQRDAAQAQADQTAATLKDTQAQLAGAQSDAQDKAQQIRLSQATIDELRGKLKKSGDAVAALTLQLEDARKKAEDTLTLLAAANAAKSDLQDKLDTQLSEAQKQAALKAVAQKALDQAEQISDEKARKVELLNQQVAALRNQLSQLQSVLDEAKQKDADAKVQIDNLGQQLNAALARAASEEKKRANLEEQQRKAAEAKAKNLEQYRSEFFGKLRQLLADQPGVRIVGDRFVFSSEVLFEPGSATLSPEGKTQIAGVSSTLKEIATEIPTDIHWILEVDGFTDATPLSGTGQFKDNWELSQARALSVVHFLIDDLGFPPDRLAAAGFGEYQPVATGDTPDARAQNRRIELKLTER